MSISPTFFKHFFFRLKCLAQLSNFVLTVCVCNFWHVAHKMLVKLTTGLRFKSFSDPREKRSDLCPQNIQLSVRSNSPVAQRHFFSFFLSLLSFFLSFLFSFILSFFLYFLFSFILSFPFFLSFFSSLFPSFSFLFRSFFISPYISRLFYPYSMFYCVSHSLFPFLWTDHANEVNVSIFLFLCPRPGAKIHFSSSSFPFFELNFLSKFFFILVFVFPHLSIWICVTWSQSYKTLKDKICSKLLAWALLQIKPCYLMLYHKL